MEDSGYKTSSSHVQTLNVLGKTRRLEDLSKDDLLEYCYLVIDEEYTAFSADDVAMELWKRFKWNVK